MNKLGNSTLIKFKNYLKLKNYSDRTIECYSWAILKFLESQNKSAVRVSEVIGLKIEDIDSKRMVIRVNNAKGRKDRLVPLSENVLNLLREYFKKYRPAEYLFNGQYSLQYSAASCNAIVKRYIDSKYHFHLLRHSCFTHLVDNGTDCRLIQKIAGHSNIKTTEGYMHVSTRTISNVRLPI